MEKDKYLVVYISQRVADVNGDDMFIFMTVKDIKEIKGEYGRDFLLYQEIDISDIK